MPYLIQLLEVFNEKSTNLLNNHEEHLKLSAIRIVAPIITYFVLLSLYTVGITMAIKEICPEVEFEDLSFNPLLVVGFVCSWCIIPTFYFLCLSSAISNGFNSINKFLISKNYCGNYFELFQVKIYGHSFQKEIEQLRFLHGLLAEATVELNKCFGTFLAIEKIFLVLAVVGNLSCYFVNATRSSFFIILTSVNFFLGSSVVSVSNSIKKRVSICYLDGANVEIE
ncbi:hypothetical protein ABEB36_001028 [Hypothenemus hampei]|uniref:Uncharacterized protein n=1 Tax=Hypothenemus hampei TaxID=57062 RepID=A0ABD1FFV2_HYPHA